MDAVDAEKIIRKSFHLESDLGGNVLGRGTEPQTAHHHCVNLCELSPHSQCSMTTIVRGVK